MHGFISRALGALAYRVAKIWMRAREGGLEFSLRIVHPVQTLPRTPGERDVHENPARVVVRTQDARGDVAIERESAVAPDEARARPRPHSAQRPEVLSPSPLSEATWNELPSGTSPSRAEKSRPRPVLFIYSGSGFLVFVNQQITCYETSGWSKKFEKLPGAQH